MIDDELSCFNNDYIYDEQKQIMRKSNINDIILNKINIDYIL